MTKFLDLSKLKSFADDIMNVAKVMISGYDDWIENIVGKGENAENQHSSASLEVEIVL